MVPLSYFLAARLLRSRFLLAANDFPALELGNRPPLLDPHLVADRELVLLVMRVILLRPPDGFFHLRVGEAAVDPHHHGLVLLVADHDALQCALRHLLFLALRFSGALLRRWLR